MKKRQMSIDDFEKETKAERETRVESEKREKGRTSIVKLRISDLKGPISYAFYDDWWWVKVGSEQVGCFTSERSARNWAKMMLGREQ